MSDAPTQLGRALREALGDGPPDPQRNAQRRRTLEAMGRSASASPARGRLLWSVSALAAAAAVAIVWSLGAPTSSLRCHDAHGVEIEAGAWVSASASASQLDFTDTSTLTLERETRMRLEEIADAHVRVYLEEGVLESDVRSPHGTVQWIFVAGPFEVEVLGTELSVDWQPALGRVVVSVVHGLVHVRRGRSDEGVAVHGGERFEARVDGDFALTTAHVEPTVLDEGEEEEEEEEELARTDVIEAPLVAEPGLEPTRRARPTSTRRDEAEDWARLAHDGEYVRAFAAAQHEGLMNITAHAEPGDVLLLADTARFAESPEDARTILVALRQRVPGTPHASMAAFRLGRLAFDHARYDEAADSFETYRREAPHGRLVDQAEGREIEALMRGGDDARAARVAHDYLQAHPEGSYRDLALSALGEQRP